MDANDIKLIELFIMIFLPSIGLISGAIKFFINPYFNSQLEAIKKLYTLRNNILPKCRMPDMKWNDACLDIAVQFKEIEKQLEYFTVIPQSIISNLNNTKNSASEGKFLDPSEMQSYTLADTLWKRTDESTKKLKHINNKLIIHNKILLLIDSQYDFKIFYKSMFVFISFIFQDKQFERLL